jgi:nucleotide-binding universal stress UspA family protein
MGRRRAKHFRSKDFKAQPPLAVPMARILVGYDGSAPSRRALEWALERAKSTGDEVILVTAIPTSVAKSSLSQMMPAGLALPEPLGKTFEQNARSRLDDVMQEFAKHGVKMSGVVRAGDPAQAFLDAVHEFSAAEIVIGHKSFESGEMALGPVAERLVRQMPATVTVVR